MKAGSAGGRPHVLQLIETGGPGGAGRVLVSLTEPLARTADLTASVGLLKQGWLSGELERRGLATRLFDLQSPLDPRLVAGLVTHLGRRQVALVHAHEFAMNLYGALAGRIAGVPVVATVHGKAYYGEHRRRVLAMRLLPVLGASVVAVSQDIRRFLEDELRVTPVHVIPNGIDVEVYGSGDRHSARARLGLDPEAWVVGAVGNLYPVKGHATLIEAVARLDDPRVRLLIAGRGGEEASLRALAERLGITTQVQLLGFRDDVVELLQAFDVYTLPSFSEGQSLALMEAMAAGLPIVASRVGGNPELLVEEQSGLLVEPGDPEGLARALRRLRSDPELKTRLGREARERARREFSLETMVARYRALYTRRGLPPAGGDQGGILSRPTTVLHLRSSGGIFGADRVVLDLCAGLEERGYHAILVPLIEPDGSGEELAAAARQTGVETHPLRLHGRADLFAARRLRALARAEGAAILHGHDYKSDGLIAAASGPWSRVATLHGRVGTSSALRIKEAVDERLVRGFDRVICVSAAMAGRVPASVVVQNGIDLRPFEDGDGASDLRVELGLEGHRMVVGAIGRLSAEKGYDVLLDAVAHLVRAGRDLDVLLIGDGPEEDALRTQAGALGLGERLHLPGVRRDAARLYPVFEVFCLPSRREGLPLALLEALAARRPVVATPVGGVPEVVGRGEDEVAVLVPPEDPEALADAIAGLLDDPERRRRLGSNGRRRVEAAFSRDKMTASVADLYDELLPRRSPPARAREESRP